jgi:predicted transcriptional regulator
MRYAIPGATVFTLKLSEEGKLMLAKLATHHGVAMRDIVEMAIRDKWRRDIDSSLAAQTKSAAHGE